MRRRTGLLIILMLLIGVLTGCTGLTDLRVRRQLDIGNRYLAEFEYDKAMLAFSKVVQIEPKRIAAYKGLSDVFTAQKEFDSSINALKRGISVADTLPSSERDAQVNQEISQLTSQVIIQLTDMGDKAYKKEDYDAAAGYYKDLIVYDSEEETSYLKLSDTYEKLGDLEKAIEILEDAELTSETITKNLDRLTIGYEVQKEYEELLGRLSQMITSGNGELGREALLSSEFLDLVSRLQEPLVLKQEEDQYIVIYPSGYVYMGQMEKGKRSGYGSYYTNNTERYVVYSGYWSGDLPNGDGRIETVAYTTSTSRSPNFYGSGGFTDGISEGEFSFSLYYQNGDRTDYVFNNTGGIPPAIRKEGGKNVVGYSINNPDHYFAMSANNMFAVPTFEKDGYNSSFTSDLTIR